MIARCLNHGLSWSYEAKIQETSAVELIAHYAVLFLYLSLR